MPKFIVTHGTLNLGNGKSAAAGEVVELAASEVEGVPSVLPFVEGEQSLAAFIADGNKPSSFKATLLARRAKVVEKAPPAPVVPPAKGK